MGCRFLLQGIFPTQGLNLCLLSWQAGSLLLSHQWTQGCLLFLSSPRNYRENAFSHFRVITLWKICFSIQKTVELVFFCFFFFIADNSKLVWFHDINLGTYEEQRTLPCLEPRGTSTFSFPFLWRQYFFLLVGWCILLTFQGESVSDMQVIIKENQKKCNYKGQGTSSFLVWNAQRKI